MAFVLIVEQDPAWRGALAHEVKRRGHTPMLFSDFRGVLALLRAPLPILTTYYDRTGASDVPSGLSLAMMARRRQLGLQIVLLRSPPDIPAELTYDSGILVSKTICQSAILDAVGLNDR